MLIRVTIKGESPLLLCKFTDADAEQISSGSSSSSRARTRALPRDQAFARLYLDTAGKPIVPGPNIFRAIIDAGRFTKSGRVQITTAKGSLVPAAVVLSEIECQIVRHDGGSPDWEVDSRSVVNPSTNGRVMVHRPRFDAWGLTFSLVVDEEMFNETLVRRIIDDAGSKIGLGAFRPSRKGPFGRFKVVNWEVTRAVSFVDPNPEHSQNAS